jgi:hypothetical protein
VRTGSPYEGNKRGGSSASVSQYCFCKLVVYGVVAFPEEGSHVVRRAFFDWNSSCCPIPESQKSVLSDISMTGNFTNGRSQCWPRKGYTRDHNRSSIDDGKSRNRPVNFLLLRVDVVRYEFA